MKVDSVSIGSQKLLSQTTKLAIINMIQHNAKPGVPYKLPNEGELAATLGVSRNVLRDSLASLAEMGLVTRRRGRGTIANTDLANAKCRITIETSGAPASLIERRPLLRPPQRHARPHPS